MQLQSGTLLQGGKYKIEQVLGQGGFGITYLATQVGLNRKVAIKEFFMREYCNRDTDTSHVTVGSEGSRDVVEKFRSKFVKEAQNIACLKHPHIISIHDVFEENGTAYYVMEYLDRSSLAELVKQRGRLSEADALRYIRQIADALRYIHERKMNHLDVKPANILIDETDGAVLIDFGLSKRYDDEGNQTSTTPVGISHGYAPLEQYKKGGVGTFSPSTDIYSLGATLYRLVTGETPPDANDVNDEGLPAFPSCVPPSVAHAIEQAMQPRRKDRPQSVDAFLALLDAEFKVEDEATMLDVKDKYENKEEHLTYPQGNSSSSLSFSFKKHFLPAVACVVVVLAVVLTISMQEKFLSVKEQYELAQNYYNGHGVTQDYIKAVEWYHKAAERGYADAQYKLGVCYYDGLGVTQDYAQSFEWCKKAAEHGLPNAQNHVGFCYKMGRGVEPDTVKAVEWYRKAAEQGQVNAQNNLGNSYYAGHGVTQDYAKAVEWYRKAAEQGFADAQYMLGLCYYDGLGVTQDYGEAVKWFRKAADFGLAKAKDALKQLENLLTEKPKPQPTTGTINGHEYVDLGLSVKWATCNVGASSPSDFGNYYAWGETDTKSEYTFSNSKTWKKNMSNIAGSASFDVARVHWGGTWRLPTKDEFQELIDKCTWTWTSQGAHNGYKVTGKNGRSIFLPAAGGRVDTRHDYAEEAGFYYSATPPYEAPFEHYAGAYSLVFGSSAQGLNYVRRYDGNTVRPVTD